MPRYLKHLVNVAALHGWIFYNIYGIVLEKVLNNHHAAPKTNQATTLNSTASPIFAPAIDNEDIDNYYWLVFIHVVIFLEYLIILPMPQIICNLLGLTFFNTFPGDIRFDKDLVPIQDRKLSGSSRINLQVEKSASSVDLAEQDSNLKNSVLLSREANDFSIPHLCFRIVTRGSYPHLVQDNVSKNYMTCVESGLVNFSIEVVTDNAIHLAKDPKEDRIRELVVPSNYRSSTGAMFKARALQYALEPGVSPIGSGDYIVHLDEETIITVNVVKGISNFALKGKYAFGQGLITYANLDVTNIITTLADSYRVADDMGKLRFQLGALHNPIFGWKGSFVVSKYEAELDVSYDHGPDASIAEDCHFSMVAMTKGYKFDFIQGEMFEKSPFTLLDFIKQRRRWVQGIWLVVHNRKIPLKTKLFLTMSHYTSLTLPITTIAVFMNTIFSLETPFLVKLMTKFCLSMTTYMYVFGLVKSNDIKPKSFPILTLYLIIQVIAITFYALVENIAVIWGLFSSKHNFYVVKKDLGEKKIPDS